MKLPEGIKNSKLLKIVLGEQNQARRLLKASQAAGFNEVEIRKGLIAFYDINVRSLVNGHGISEETIYATIRGNRNNELAKRLVAEAIGLPVIELWSE